VDNTFLDVGLTYREYLALCHTLDARCLTSNPIT